VLVAEAMLQQTRAEVVAERLPAFLARYPDFARLASAPLADVLRAWEGLGYYRRAASLHRTAALAAAAGGLPEDPAALGELPGIGPYSARAIACFAFGRPEPPLDANLRRVALRLAGQRGDPRSSASAALADGVLRPVLAGGQAARVGDALMDLGALVCTARRPRCGACPLAVGCAARGTGAPEEIGRPAPRPERTVLRIVALQVVSSAGAAWRPRPDKGLLAGLWEPPHVLAPTEPDADAIQKALAEWGIAGWREVGARRPLRHVFSHQVWLGEVRRLASPPDPLRPPARWLAPDELAAVALPAAFRAVLGGDRDGDR